MCSEIRNMFLDRALTNHGRPNDMIIESIRSVAEELCLKLLRYDFKGIDLALNISDSINLQAEAKSNKREAILGPEGKELLKKIGQ